MSKWEPTKKSINEAIRERMKHYGDDFELNASMRATLIAAVSADPLLSAAKDMQDALIRLSELTPAAANAKDARDLHMTVKAIADAALFKSRGEG